MKLYLKQEANILYYSKSCRSIKIDHPDLQNNLQIISREVYVILEDDIHKNNI